ncbi:hypothetical protein T09_14597 [Trichinella sp. T9]|nr:hypothetical protein T09_14597 [Trichinella sp. T9]
MYERQTGFFIQTAKLIDIKILGLQIRKIQIELSQ